MNMHRGPSTKYNESFHIKNANTDITLNIFLCVHRGIVDFQTYDWREKNPWKQHNQKLEIDTIITDDELAELCKKYLNRIE